MHLLQKVEQSLLEELVMVKRICRKWRLHTSAVRQHIDPKKKEEEEEER